LNKNSNRSILRKEPEICRSDNAWKTFPKLSRMLIFGSFNKSYAGASASLNAEAGAITSFL
jgi:hypothetical protein